MKTPIQELMMFFQTAIDNSKRKEVIYILDTLKTIAEASLEKEKQFAFECFEAGENYYKGNHNAFSERYPKFEEFYKQFEQ